MSRTAHFLIFGAVFTLISGPSQAQGTTGSTGGEDRFIYDQVDEGILRLDSRSGEVSLCSRQENQGWACRIVADERRALDSEIGRLQRENAEMRKLLTEGGVNPPGASVGSEPRPPTAVQPEAVPAPTMPDRSAEKAPGKAETKPDRTALTEQLNLTRAREVAAAIWRRLVEMMAHVKADLQNRT